MVGYCAAYNCKAMSVKGGFSFHSFPKDPKLLKLWVLAMKRKDFMPSKHSRLCGRHFSKDAYSTSPWSSVNVLKPDAVPTIFDFPEHLMNPMQSRKPGSREKTSSHEPLATLKHETPDAIMKSIEATSKISCITDGSINEEFQLTMDDHSGRTLDVCASVKAIRAKIYKRKMDVVDEGDVFLPSTSSSTDSHVSETVSNTRCRLCASKGKRLEHIFSEEGKKMALAFKINKLLPMMVSPRDKLPLKVCRECIAELNNSVTFVQRCMGNQVKLRRILKISPQDLDVPSEIIKTLPTRSLLEKKNENINISRTGQMDRLKKCSFQIEEKSEKLRRNKRLKTMKMEFGHDIDKCHGANIPSESLENASFVKIKNEDPPSHINAANNRSAFENGEDSLSDSKLAENKVLIERNSDDNSVGLISVNDTSNNNCKHICEYCEEGFSWKADLFDHQTIVHPDLVFRCTYCLKMFYDKGTFESHELAHIRQLPPGFKGKIGIRKHLKECFPSYQGKIIREKLSHHFAMNKNGMQSSKNGSGKSAKKRAGKCDSTGGTNKSSVDFNDNNEDDKKCNYCDITFETVKILRRHIQMEHRLRFPCRFCPRTCSFGYELKRHEERHHKEANRHLICNKCNKILGSTDVLKEHRLIHMHLNGPKCEICTEVFCDEDSLEEHIKTHVGERDYLCETCGQSFESFFIFRFHKMSHLYSDIQMCQLCDDLFHSPKDLETHLETAHKKKVKFQCKVCQQNFSTRELLKEHKVVHESTEYKCEVCSKTFTSAKKLRNHNQTHKMERNYLCEKCGKDFKSNSSLHKHRYLCQVAIACSVCKREFDCNTRLKVHMRIHTGEKPFVCPVCGKGFHASWSLNQHTVTHNSVKIPCPMCGALFNRKANMLTHMKRHRVPCETCGQVFANTPLLLAHQKIHAENGEVEAEDPSSKNRASSVSYKCDECGKLFVTSLDLKAHIPTHSEERPHKCNICGKSWRLQKTLKKHMVIHSGQKPYQCRYCTCTFVLHQRLVKHENGHTAGKPYVCQVCGQSFWTQLNLEKHSFRHNTAGSAEQKFTCNYCKKSFEHKSSLVIHKRTHTAQLNYGCSFCPRKFSQLRFAQRHKCALNPNTQPADSSAQKVLIPSLPTVTEIASNDGDNASPGVLNEEVVFDMDSTAPYAEIIVISQSMDDLIVENNNELNK